MENLGKSVTQLSAIDILDWSGCHSFKRISGSASGLWQTIAGCLLTLLFTTTVFCKAGNCEEVGATAPESATSEPAVQTPERPPLPAPPVVPMPAPRGSGLAKPPLAWRAKAPSELTDQLSSKPLVRSFFASTADTLMAVISACPVFGLRIKSVDSAEGKIVAVSEDEHLGAAQLVINLAALACDRTSMKVLLLPQSQALRSVVASLMARVSQDLSTRDSI